MPRSTKSSILNQQKEPTVADTKPTETDTAEKTKRPRRPADVAAKENLEAAKRIFERKHEAMQKIGNGLTGQAQSYRQARHRLNSALTNPALPADVEPYSLPATPAILDVILGTSTPGNATLPAAETLLGSDQSEPDEIEDEDEGDDDSALGAGWKPGDDA